MAQDEDKKPEDQVQGPPPAERGEGHYPASFPSGPAWYAVQTYQHEERRARDNLERLDYGVYLPMEKRWVRHARRREIKERALFQRYLFVCLDINRDSFLAVERSDGVRTVLKQNDIPARVPDKLVEELRHAESIGRFDETIGKNNLNLEPGAQVRLIDAGAFDDQVAIFARADSKRRVEVLLEIMGRQTKLEVDVAQIRKI